MKIYEVNVGNKRLIIIKTTDKGSAIRQVMKEFPKDQWHECNERSDLNNLKPNQLYDIDVAMMLTIGMATEDENGIARSLSHFGLRARKIFNSSNQ